ncbi:Transcription elongation factor, mitochondrial [Ooceraea biroi]|uniref:Transcription elongation factor, mitochondrial n=1 Tax=Ooceraea biroi TaxID=2015173 RepID=A0A026WZM7_OOCBI|nr:Transcription elongation factor, mitochondrial [Ooceraea biroi]
MLKVDCFYLQIYKHWGSSVVGCKMNSTYNEAIDEDLFSLENKEKILKVINSKNVEDLLQYSITKKRAQTLESHRADSGPYKSLEELLQVKGMNNKCLYKFYKSIIYGKKRSESKKITRGLFLTPKTTGDEHKDVNTVLGIYIGPDMISWLLLNRDCEVLKWSYKSFSQEKDKLKLNLHSLLQMTLPIAAQLPKADRYIMQETNKVGRKFYQANVRECVINAIILSYLTTLNCRFDNSAEFAMNNIFIFRQRTLQKIYGLMVDHEIISTQYVVQKFLQESDKVTKGVEEHLPSVLIRTELRKMYNAQSPIYQEQISWSLLIALAFMELIVHQRTDMIVRNAK